MIEYDHDKEQYIIPTFEESVERLRQFVAQRSESEGGWAPVGPEDLPTFLDIMYDILHLKYEMDPDGDIPVTVRLRDRTKNEPNNFGDLPHLDSDAAPIEDLLYYMSTANMNLAMAQEQVNRAYRMFDWRFREGPKLRAQEAEKLKKFREEYRAQEATHG